MTHRTKEIDDLFSMFHDFEIVGIKLISETLRMEILLPWNQITSFCIATVLHLSETKLDK
jgi:hypothetical protein